jgi:PKD repeat protein
MKKIFPLLLIFSIISISILSVIPIGVDGGLYDDFSGTTIDTAKWKIVEKYDILWSIEDGKAKAAGIRNGGGDWAYSDNWVYLESKQEFNGYLEVSVEDSIDGGGTGYSCGLWLYQDDENSILWGQIFDLYGGKNRIGELDIRESGVFKDLFLDNSDIVPNVFQEHKIIYHENGTAEFYLNGVLKGTYNLPLSNFRIRLRVRTRLNGDSVVARFDNLTAGDTRLPIASLSVSQNRIDKNDTISFDGSNSISYQGEITEYFFDYGDGHNSGWITESISSHTYITKGTFSARLKVMTSLGNVSDWSSAVDIFVDNTPPIASLIVYPSTILTYEATNISGTSSYDTDGNVVEYYFAFGDDTGSGWISTGDVTHEYEKDGFYYIGLMVRDDDGLESAWEIITVVVKNRAPIPNLEASETVIELGDVITFYAAK